MKVNQLFNLNIFIYLIVAVKVNPLPAPRKIIWSDDDPIKLSPETELSLSHPDDVVYGAFDRFNSTLNRLKPWAINPVKSPIK